MDRLSELYYTLHVFTRFINLEVKEVNVSLCWVVVLYTFNCRSYDNMHF